MPQQANDAEGGQSPKKEPKSLSPLPPASIDLLLEGPVLQRYVRKGTDQDADKAVVGRGGFGTAYRYTKDKTFTPTSSWDFSTNSDGGREAMEVLKPKEAAVLLAPIFSSDPTALRSKGVNSSPKQHRLAKARSTPSVIVIKICRTPCTGSFDELPKTSLVERRQRKILLQDNSLSHVRVVRGEARILRYLQAAQETTAKVRDANVVKMLGNLPMNGRGPGNGLSYEEWDSPDDQEPEADDGPPSRLLVFERLVEIDFELNKDGWSKCTTAWSVDKVERMALEIMQGLNFLHKHNVTHGDLKPSNLMRDVRTGCIKIIDLGASRRFVKLPNAERDDTQAVERHDREQFAQSQAIPTLSSEFCEGLGSLTGSPHYMAPEVLLQATRYTDAKGRSRTVLNDYEPHHTQCFTPEFQEYFRLALNDLKRGWGIKADIWSWACTVMALLLRTIDPAERPSPAAVCPFDFSFSKHQNRVLEPLHQLWPEERDLPRFHIWSRALPIYIMELTVKGVDLHPVAEKCSPELKAMLRSSLRHQDNRLTATEICRLLPRPSLRELMADRPTGEFLSPALAFQELPGNEGIKKSPAPTMSSPFLSGQHFSPSPKGTNTLLEIPARQPAWQGDAKRTLLSSAQGNGLTFVVPMQHQASSSSESPIPDKPVESSWVPDTSKLDRLSQDSSFQRAFITEMNRMSPVLPVAPLPPVSLKENQVKETSLLLSSLGSVENIPSRERSAPSRLSGIKKLKRPSTSPGICQPASEESSGLSFLLKHPQLIPVAPPLPESSKEDQTMEPSLRFGSIGSIENIPSRERTALPRLSGIRKSKRPSTSPGTRQPAPGELPGLSFLLKPPQLKSKGSKGRLNASSDQPSSANGQPPEACRSRMLAVSPTTEDDESRREGISSESGGKYSRARSLSLTRLSKRFMKGIPEHDRVAEQVEPTAPWIDHSLAQSELTLNAQHPGEFGLGLDLDPGNMDPAWSLRERAESRASYRPSRSSKDGSSRRFIFRSLQDFSKGLSPRSMSVNLGSSTHSPEDSRDWSTRASGHQGWKEPWRLSVSKGKRISRFLKRKMSSSLKT